jgi:uncharacterized membrane protein
MSALKRHSAVFLALLVIASIVALVQPLSVDSKDVIFYFVLGFLIYLAAYYVWAAFGSRRV